MTDPEAGAGIVHVDDLEWTGIDDDGGGYKRVGRAAGGERLGCTLEEILPGGRPARYHYHVANEEALYVLEGEGSLRTPDGETGVETGDYASFPAGEAGAHSIENTSSKPLRCLLFSTMSEPDVVVYPDEGEIGVVTGAAGGRLREGFTIDAEVAFEADDRDDPT